MAAEKARPRTFYLTFNPVRWPKFCPDFMKSSCRYLVVLLCLLGQRVGWTQSLIDIDFGGNTVTFARGPAGTGQGTNDYWNAYSHYTPRFSPGMHEVPNGQLGELKFADGSPSKANITVTNAPGVWGNATGDPMIDSFIFAPNGSNIVVTINGLEPGRYHFFVYGHADADGGPEQNSVFSMRVGNSPGRIGPLAVSSLSGWHAGQPWQEGRHFVVFRDVVVHVGEPVVLEVAPGAGGIAVLNGLQIFSRGTAPPRVSPAEIAGGGAAVTNLLFREIRYEGVVTGGSAKFKTFIDVESLVTNELSAVLFEGDVALLNPKLPPGWRIVPNGRQFQLVSGAPGAHRIEMELSARVSRAEPWNEISFAGPPAAIGTISIGSTGPGTEIHLSSGTELDAAGADKSGTNALVRGVLGPDGRVGVRWQSQAAEINREAVISAQTVATVQLTPSVVRVTTVIRYDAVQGRFGQTKISVPSDQSLTKVAGDAIRDWHVENTTSGSEVTIEFLRQIDKSTSVTLLTEQAVAQLPAIVNLAPPQPLGVQKEQGALILAVEDVLAKVDSIVGLRQVDSTPTAAAAYNFSTRPATAKANLARVEPVVKVADRVRLRLEETRLRVEHQLALNIERAGIYFLEAPVPEGFTVAEIVGAGVEDWRVTTNRIKIGFSRRAIGEVKLAILTEKALPTVPPELVIDPLRVVGAEKETAYIGVSAVPGLTLKTGSLARLREIPVSALPESSTELLAYRAEVADWRLTLAAERPPSRLVAEVFNLITVGDGLVGGSATLRYAIVNQGVQSFQVLLPPHWRNVEFVGANIRRTDHLSNVWTIALQDKAWDAYTLVVTYDYPFESRQASLDAGGAHPLAVERETGTLAVTAAAGLELKATPFVEPLRPIDPSELNTADRALVSRQVVLAGKYEGTNYNLTLGVTRHDQVVVLDAVADRAQLKSVVTDQGEMLTQASFMVKNNGRQFQRFLLPAGATLWGAAVDNEPVKADRDGDWVLVSLPRNADRDRAFAVDLSYAQQAEAFKRSGSLYPKLVELVAPSTDVPGTYAEWDIYAPTSKHLGSFGGNMIAARSARYGFHEAWAEFVGFYRGVLYEHGISIVLSTAALAFVAGSIFMIKRRGFRGFVFALLAGAVALLLAGMLTPALAKAKSRAQRITASGNLRYIGMAINKYASEHNGAFPQTLGELIPGEISEKTLIHPGTGEQFTYVGAGLSDSVPSSVVAYGPNVDGHIDVLFADGSVQSGDSARFGEWITASAKSQSDSKSQFHSAKNADIASDMVIPERPTSGAEGDKLAKKETTKDRFMMEPSLARRYGLIANEAKAQAVQELEKVSALGNTLKSEGLGVPAAEAPTAAPSFSPPTVNFTGGAKPGGSAATAAAPPTVAGLKSLKIEIPKSGQHLQFTRTLNINKEPAKVALRVMSNKSFVLLRSAFQLGCFLSGLIITWVQWRRESASALWLAAGTLLAILGAGSLFIAWHQLHLVLIGSVPLALLIGLAWVVRRVIATWPKRRTAAVTPPPDLPGGPAVVSGAAMLFLLVAFQPSTNAAVAASTQPISVVSADFTGDATEHSARFDAVLELVSSATNQTAILFGKEVGLQEFAATKGDVRLWREGDNVGVLMPVPGTATIKLKLIAKVVGDIGKRTLDFALPAALGNHLVVELHEPDAEVDCAGAIAFSRTTNAAGTSIDAILPPSARLGLSWSPRLKKAADGAVTVFSHQTSLISAGGGAVSTWTRFDFSTPQGELRSLRVALPPSHRLLRVTGDAVRTWDTSPANRSELTVELGRASNAVSIVVETEGPLAALPAKIDVAVPRALDVRRATGIVGVRAIDEAGLTVERVEGLERIELAEFEKAYGKDALGLAGAWRFQRPEFGLGLAVQTLVPQLEATVRNHFVVGTEQLTLQSFATFKITKAGTFSLHLAVPADFQIDSVLCDSMRSWDEQTVAGGREIEILLKQKTLGVVHVAVSAMRAMSNLPGALALAGIHPIDAVKITGYVSAAAEAGLALKTGTLSGITEIPVAELSPERVRQAPILAYKYLAFQATPAAPWTLSLLPDALESWVRAEVASTYLVSETMVTGSAVVKYDIQNAPRKDFSLKVPANWRNVEISGAGIRRRDAVTNGEVGTWRVELQNKVQGDFRLSAKWEQPRVTTNNVVLAGVETVGTERETGWLALDAATQLQLVPNGTNDALLRIDAAELPAWAPGRQNVSTATASLTFRYLRVGWTLPAGVERYQDAAVLQALAEQTQLRTVVAEDGQWMTRLSLRIRNNGRQNVSVTLPARAHAWSAFVDGQPVRPAQRDGRLLLPLESSRDRDTPVSIEITYVGEDPFPKNSGAFLLESPRLDIPLKEAHWEVFLPPDYNYDRFAGTMNYEGADYTAMVQDFTLAAYNRQENEQRQVADAEAAETLDKVRRGVAMGRFGGFSLLNNYRGLWNNSMLNKEVESLAESVNRSQASNLIQAQQRYAGENGMFGLNSGQGGFGGAGQGGGQGGGLGGEAYAYSTDVAVKQAAQVERAQALAVARVTPLHVNLPTYGIRHSFAQVLQTETDRPLTVTMRAANDRETGWAGLIGRFVGGFAMLWLGCYVVLSLRNSRA